MNVKSYDRFRALEYAKTWAFNRNPKFHNFDNLGGDCTNFVSQCIFAGAKTMNYTPILGWYYNNLNDRTPSWSGVKFLHNFLINNIGVGPVGRIINFSDVKPADVIFLKRNNGEFYHSLFVSNVNDNQIFVSAHTFDAYNRNLFSYSFDKAVFVHIEKINVE